jgi:hypothetical protein
VIAGRIFHASRSLAVLLILRLADYSRSSRQRFLEDHLNRQPTFFRWLRKEALSAWRFDPVRILQNPQKKYRCWPRG